MEGKLKLTIPEMLQKLDELYDKEDKLIKEINKLGILYQQMQDDKEFLQTMIMYQSNRLKRERG